MLLPFKTRRKRFKPGDETEEYLLSRLVYNPTLGLNYSLPAMEIDDRAVSGCKNVRFYVGEIWKRKGYKTLGGNLPLGGGRIMGFDQFFDYAGKEHLVCYSLTKAYCYNTTIKNWDDITQTGADFSGDEDNFFLSENMYDDSSGSMKYFITNGADAPQVWTGSGKLADATVPTGLTKSDKVTNFQHHLLYLGNTISGNNYPQRIDWSAQGKPEDFTSSGSGNNNLAKSTDWITGSEILKNSLIVFKERSITMVHYVGGVNPFIFEENKIDGIGCSAGKTIGALGSSLVFLGWDNVYEYNGFNVTAVGDKIQKELINKINPEYINRSHAIIVEELNLYLLFVPTVGSDSCNAVWVWDYLEDNWSYWEFEDAICSTGYYQSSGALTIGQLTDRIKDLDWRFGDRTITSISPITLLGDDAGNVYEFNLLELNDNDVAIDGEIKTKNFFLNNTGKYARVCQFWIYAIGDSIDLYYSIDNGLTWIFVETLELDGSTYGPVISRDLEITSERIMFKMKNNTLNETFKIRGWDIKYIKKGNVLRSEHLFRVKTNKLINIKDNDFDQIYVEG